MDEGKRNMDILHSSTARGTPIKKNPLASMNSQISSASFRKGNNDYNMSIPSFKTKIAVSTKSAAHSSFEK